MKQREVSARQDVFRPARRSALWTCFDQTDGLFSWHRHSTKTMQKKGKYLTLKLAALYRANSLFYLSSDLFCDTAKRKTLCLSGCIILIVSALFYFFIGPLSKTLWISNRNRLPFCFVATKGCRYQWAENHPLGFCGDLSVEETDACLEMPWREHDVIHRCHERRGEAPNSGAPLAVQAATSLHRRTSNRQKC